MEQPGDLVLDPFGSGTTAKAAKEWGAGSWGLEINPEYCAIAERRIAQQVLELGRITLEVRRSEGRRPCESYDRTSYAASWGAARHAD